MNLNFLVAIILAYFSLSACTSHWGSVSQSDGASAVNHKYIDVASGRAESTRFLGIGGNKKDALVSEARQNLMKNSSLKEGEYLGNLTTDFKTTNYIFITKTKATVTADILCTTCDSVKGRYSKLYMAKISGKSTLETDTSRSLEVLVHYGNSYVQGRVIKELNSNRVIVRYTTPTDTLVIKNLSRTRLFYIEAENAGLSTGDSVSYKLYNSEMGMTKHYTGIIKGLNFKYALVADQTGKLTLVKLEKISQKAN